MERTILLSLSDVVLVDDRGVEIRTKKLRFGRLRLFVLSIILGISIGVMLSVLHPQGSLDASLRARAWCRAAVADVVAFVKAIY